MKRYCESISQTIRRKTREVNVGSVGIGAQNPIRIQSMATTPTRDVSLTIDQIMRLSDAGCEIVRVTVQGKKEAESCEHIKNGLVQRGYSIPLVADIHFYPPAAMQVVEFVDKIRINPGNFCKEQVEVFPPLVEKCIRYQKAMRIGVNHGSLSERIMNQYGNTPLGMVESALEYAHICRKMHYHNLVFSMKASNPIVMIEAYRLLSAKMIELGWDYPFHLGVTEAGAGEDGRIKSAMGIGALLMDGLGDTIRVSLTEDPVQEIDPCKRIIQFYETRQNVGIEPFEEHQRFLPRKSIPPFHPQGAVILHGVNDKADAFYQDLSSFVLKDETNLSQTSSWPLILFHPLNSPIHETRKLIEELKNRRIDTPVILCLSYSCSWEDTVIHSAIEAGAILSDRLAEGICIIADQSSEKKLQLSFDLLQSARMRMTKTEFISCPGCGRTLFDIQTVAQSIRQRTSHLPNVKIAIMGCVVNGPGEMADADFGYVGSKPGKIDLYVGKTCVEKEIDSKMAVDRLISIISSHGKWVEPVNQN